MIVKRNQILKRFVRDPQVALVVLVLGITLLPLGLQSKDDKAEQALFAAKKIGIQVVGIYREATSVGIGEEARSPASASTTGGLRGLRDEFRSTGTTGRDPWGKPYHYRLLSEDEQGSIRILVWSSGPNQKAESLDLLDELKDVQHQPVYSGDDLGVLLSMSHN